MTAKKKKVLLIVCLVVAGLLFLYAILALWPKGSNYATNPMRKEKNALPILIAHGGGNGEFPDNTLEAFYNAYSVDENVMMETDVSITKDGVVILSHDTDIADKTPLTGNIIDWNYSDLIAQEVDFGWDYDVVDKVKVDRRFKNQNGEFVTPEDVDYPEGVEARHSTVFLATTLEELITAFPNNRINVEIKQEGDEGGIAALNEVLRLLDKYDAFDRVVLASFHEEIYDEYQRIQKEGVSANGIKIPNCFMYSPAYDSAIAFFVLQMLQLDVFYNDKICVFQLPTEQYGFDLSTKSFVEKAHSHNLAVHYWTVNDVEEMEELIKIGADGIMTDYPHRLKEVYDNYNG
ncbi:MAG: hypothetical protein J6B04_04020 [Clostridia bacterium]|nr:hypothetical protein [Clostridia bacterium]